MGRREELEETLESRGLGRHGKTRTRSAVSVSGGGLWMLETEAALLNSRSQISNGFEINLSSLNLFLGQGGATALPATHK